MSLFCKKGLTKFSDPIAVLCISSVHRVTLSSNSSHVCIVCVFVCREPNHYSPPSSKYFVYRERSKCTQICLNYYCYTLSMYSPIVKQSSLCVGIPF